MNSRVWAIVAVSGLWVGCGGEADKALNDYKKASLTSQADVEAWAGTASAPNVYIAANLGAFLSGVTGIGSGSQDATCPAKKVDGITTTVSGGCTDKNGYEWFGTMEQKLEKEGSENGTITYKGFGYQQSATCGGKSYKSKLIFTGSSKVEGSAKKEFDLDIRMDVSGPHKDTCAETTSSGAWSYQGSFEGSTSITSGRRVWNGSGRIGTSELGVVEVETKDEVIDSAVCDDEAASGTTTIKSDGHTAVITYDGATDCDEASTVKSSLDGKAAVEIEDISCASASGPVLSAWSLGLLGALGLLRRRARR